MNKELSTLDQCLTDSEWGKSNIKETNNRKIRRNLLTDEELACDQDDLGNFVSIWGCLKKSPPHPPTRSWA